MMPGLPRGGMTLTTRTPTEIVERIKEVEGKDFLGFQESDLLEFLPFEDAKPYLKDDVTAEEWETARSKKLAKDCVIDYLPLAWGKANDCRGLSARRSVDHLKAWLWLAGFDDAPERLGEVYEFYGKPCLVLASEIVGFDWPAQDDGRWDNDEDGDGLTDSERARLIERMQQIAAELKAAAWKPGSLRMTPAEVKAIRDQVGSTKLMAELLEVTPRAVRYLLRSGVKRAKLEREIKGLIQDGIAAPRTNNTTANKEGE